MAEPEAPERHEAIPNPTIWPAVVAGAAVGVPVLSYVITPLLRPSPQEWFSIGAIDSFQVGQTVLKSLPDVSPVAWAGQVADSAIWVRRTADQAFTVFAINCTHLG